MRKTDLATPSEPPACGKRDSTERKEDAQTGGVAMPDPTDTDRLNWLESMGAEVCIPKTDDLLATGYYVHTHFTSWVHGDNLRGAIDNARRRLEEGGQ